MRNDKGEVRRNKIFGAGIIGLMMLMPISYIEATGQTVEAGMEAETEAGVKKKIAGLDGERKELMDFLYNYISLPDKADYPFEFYLRNVDASLRAREEMPWGMKVPEREFLHFVVPVRVNNENLDMAREVFYEELKERVNGLSMEDAILEVNHWCHEKVTYKPSDARTSSPLSAMSQAIGRCGEESTFTVAALRSVGIPARQVYTPRWAHTDDNHAWVEAWADGKWHFIGACEPEPILDLAWFNAPASRGMLMSTNVIGDYRGPEEVLERDNLYTKINVTENYAPVKRLDVKICDKEGKPVEDAIVNFCIYNYAEYYPVAKRRTGSDGTASLICGDGDLLVWGSDGRNFGFSPAHPTPGDTLLLTLDKSPDYSGVAEFTLVPPKGGTGIPQPTEEQRNLNTRRFQREDSIRKAYTSTFATGSQTEGIAAELGLDARRFTKVLVESRGNHKVLTEYLRSLTPEKRTTALQLLENVTEKDRRDIPVEVIADNVDNFQIDGDTISEFIVRNVLSPRIENEGLTAFRGYLRSQFTEEQIAKIKKNPASIADWIGERVTVTSEENPQNLRMSPRGILKAGKGNALSRNILYVAVARSLGIPARIDPVTGKTQYSNQEGTWEDVSFRTEAEAPTAESEPKGELKLNYTPSKYLSNPKYYTHFSISKLKDGEPVLLEFDEQTTTAESFKAPYTLDSGQYILTTGRRLADGSVLARSEIFSITPAETSELPLVIRDDEKALSVIGSLNAEALYEDMATKKMKSILSTTGRGYYVLGFIRANHEPSAHAINDISAAAEDLEKTGNKLVLLFENEDEALRFNRSLFGKLPENLYWGVDSTGEIRKEIETSLGLDSKDNPLIVVADTFNRIVSVTHGYTIGLGEKLLDILHRVN